jgi:hypothetical protein
MKDERLPKRRAGQYSDFSYLNCGVLADEQCCLAGVPDDQIVSNQTRWS